jgi:hypothetical protein
VEADEARDSDAATADRIERRERLVVVMVDLGEVAQLRVAQLRKRREEAAIARLRAQAREARDQERLVGRLNGAHQDPGAVAQHQSPGRIAHRA